jgi:hypothetical protein
LGYRQVLSLSPHRNLSAIVRRRRSPAF